MLSGSQESVGHFSWLQVSTPTGVVSIKLSGPFIASLMNHKELTDTNWKPHAGAVCSTAVLQLHP